MQQFARGLQIVALLLLPLGMILQIAKSISVGQMLMLLVAGLSLFYIGWIVEGYLRSGR
ncbi:MAG TPA: hypothetical protein VG125_15910 [Pirellulales bacterium]|jgi:hypothetical protein|nr:hypothetical protein [Pirellulales bacterium]